MIAGYTLRNLDVTEATSPANSANQQNVSLKTRNVNLLAFSIALKYDSKVKLTEYAPMGPLHRYDL